MKKHPKYVTSFFVLQLDKEYIFFKANHQCFYYVFMSLKLDKFL